jgi:hypothetical protein
VATATTSDLLIPATTHYAVKVTPNFRFIAFILGSSTGSCAIFPINVPPTALFIRPGTSGAAVNGNAITPSSITASGAITGLSFTATQASGSNAFIASTGARWKIGGGTTDYFSSNGTTTITAAGNLNADSSIQAGVASANEVTLAGAASASPVTITASGSDTDVDVNVVPKGAGSLEVDDREVLVFSGTGHDAEMVCYGQATLSGGNGTGDFSTTCGENFGSAPLCWMSSLSVNPCYYSATTTDDVTIVGTGTDKCNWWCVGATP